MKSSLLLACVLLNAACVKAQSVSVEEALDAVDRLSTSVTSFDIRMSVTDRQMFKTEGLPESVTPGEQLPDFTIVSVPPGEEIVTTEQFRQVYSDSGNEDVPRHRVQEFNTEGDTISILAFDGEVRQSYYTDANSGLIGPPRPNYRYTRAGGDYLILLGTIHNGRRISEYFRERETTIVQDGEMLLLEAPPTAEVTRIPMNGYRAWLDPAHGMRIARFENYEMIPSNWNGQDFGGDDREYVVYSFVIDEFHQADQDLWVPKRATTNQNRMRVHRGAEGLMIELQRLHEIVAVVETDKSNWNTEIDRNEFAIDYPVGTQVFDEFLGNSFVVEE